MPCSWTDGGRRGIALCRESLAARKENGLAGYLIQDATLGKMLAVDGRAEEAAAVLEGYWAHRSDTGQEWGDVRARRARGHLHEARELLVKMDLEWWLVRADALEEQIATA